MPPFPLRLERLRRGLDQREVAAALGVDQASISDVELGERGPAGTVFNALCRHYDLPSARMVASMARWRREHGAGRARARPRGRQVGNTRTRLCGDAPA